MMLDNFRTAVNVLGADVQRAVDLCCTTPATIAGLRHLGTLEPGKRADLVLLSASLEVERTVVGGELAHSAAGAPPPAPPPGAGSGGEGASL